MFIAKHNMFMDESDDRLDPVANRGEGPELGPGHTISRSVSQ